MAYFIAAGCFVVNIGHAGEFKVLSLRFKVREKSLSDQFHLAEENLCVSRCFKKEEKKQFINLSLIYSTHIAFRVFSFFCVRILNRNYCYA
jgi:hypothetical protein